MRRIVNKLFFMFLAIAFICFGGVVLAEEKNQVHAFNATFEFVSNVKTVDLGYGITHIKDIAKSTKLKDGELLPQSVNILEIPSTEDVRIVNWVHSNPNSWSKQTVRTMANDFENKNPGWVVVAAINGDFFDIDGDDKRLPYQTNGVTVSMGETYRPFTNAQTIGFKNDGSSNSMVAGKKFEVSPHYLNIYDNDGNVIYEKEVKHFNEEPLDGEVSIWYTYKNEKGEMIKMTLPEENSFYINAPTKILPMSTSNVYLKGKINAINQSVEMYYGQCGIQTNNQEIKNLLEIGTTIRIQQNVIGDYADCTDITGGGVTLVKDGEAIDNTSDSDTHPRTCVGIKKDGTLVFMTVDGRQESLDMYGMAYNELSATMLYYGCNEAYNLDGGGSTTMLTRNQFGDFDVENSPSDGVERHDSNSIFVVVPEIYLEVNDVSSTEVVIDYKGSSDRNIVVKDIEVTLNGETKIINEFPYTWKGLEKQTAYDIYASYKITYKGIEKKKETFPIKINTGAEKPLLENSYYYVYNNKVYINYSIDNPDGLKIMINLASGKKLYELKALKTIISYDLSSIVKDNIVIKLGYNINSSHSKYQEDDYKLEERNIESVKKKVTFNLNGGKMGVEEITYIPGVGISNLPIPKKPLHKFIGWKCDGQFISKIPTTFDKDIELIAVYEKGCQKSHTEILISTLSLASLAVLVLRKK